MRRLITDLLVCMGLAACAFGASVDRRARIFKIERLTSPPKENRMPLWLPGNLVATAPDQEYRGGPGGASFTFGESEVGKVELSPLYSSFVKPAELSELIRTFVSEDSWANERNEINVAAGKLTVVQTPATLAEIESFLTVLYARRMRRLDVAVAVVPPAALQQAVTAEDRRAGGPLLPGEAFDRVVALAGESGTRWQTTAEEGEQVAFGPLARRLSFKDLDVNQTGVAPVVNAVVGTVRNGLGMAVRCARTPLEDAYLVEFTIARITTSPAGNIRKTPLGDLELFDASGASLTGSLVAPAGKTLVLGHFTWPRRDPAPFAVLARVREVPQAARPAASFAIIEAGGLLRPWFHVSGLPYRDGDEFDISAPSGTYLEDEKPLFTPEQLLERARTVLPAKLQQNPRLRLRLAGSGLFVSVHGDPAATNRAADCIREHLRACFRTRAGMVEAHVRQGTIAASDLERIKEEQKGGVLLAPAWRAQVELERETAIRFAGLADKAMTLFAGSGKRYVADIETVSGGGRYTVTEVPDPIVRWTGTGIELTARIKPVPSTPWVQVHVSGTVAETAFKDTISVYADHTVKRGGPYGIRPVGPKITIDLPGQQADEWQHAVTVPAGRACLLNAFPDPEEPSKMRILVVEPRVYSGVPEPAGAR